MSLNQYRPPWAARDNPIVRRVAGHITGTLDIDRFKLIYAIQVGVIIISILFTALTGVKLNTPLLTTLLIPVVSLVYFLGFTSVIALPIMFIIYGRLLFEVNRASHDHLFAAHKSQALTVLRTTPPPLGHALLSHITGAMWRQVESLNTLMWLVVTISLPLLTVQYMAYLNDIAQTGMMQLVVLCALTVSVLRPVLELVMAGALGVMLSTQANIRIVGQIGGAVLLVSYFVLINLPRLLPLSIGMRLLIEIVLPLVLPVILTWTMLRISCTILQRD